MVLESHVPLYLLGEKWCPKPALCSSEEACDQIDLIRTSQELNKNCWKERLAFLLGLYITLHRWKYRAVTPEVGRWKTQSGEKDQQMEKCYLTAWFKPSIKVRWQSASLLNFLVMWPINSSWFGLGFCCSGSSFAPNTPVSYFSYFNFHIFH